MDLAAREWELWSTRARLVTDADVLDEACRFADDLLADVERACSRFRLDSEILTLHPDAEGWATLSPTLADLMREALAAARISDGAVDPTVGGALAALGYDRDIRSLTSSGTTTVVRRPAVGWQQVRLEKNRMQVPAGVLLDLGATAKAVAADRIANAVADRFGSGVLVSLGGDIATAGPGPEEGWQVTVQDLPDDTPTQISLQPGAAVATSSTAKRTWQRNGETLHHLIDPATGRPAHGPWRAASVVAERCALANTASTGALVKGQDAVGWLRRLRLPARLVGHDGAAVLLNGWPDEVQR
jgi:thiamine biosynthesis lipoprotein